MIFGGDCRGVVLLLVIIQKPTQHQRAVIPGYAVIKYCRLKNFESEMRPSIVVDRLRVMTEKAALSHRIRSPSTNRNTTASSTPEKQTRELCQEDPEAHSRCGG